MEPFYCPQPKSLIEAYHPKTQQLRPSKQALAIFDNLINATIEKVPLPPHQFITDQKTSLSKNQVMYDEYFGVKRCSQNPFKVLEIATLKAAELLQVELQKGSHLSATEITDLSSGIISVLSILEPILPEGHYE